MEICYKQTNFQITKAVSDEGSFEAYVAAYNNIDFGDDIIDPQAFSDEPVGKTYPYLSDHETRTVIGNWKAVSDGFGVKMVDAKFNLMRDEQTGNFMVPKAAEKYANLKNGDITGFSVGYIPTDIEWKEVDGRKIRVIKKAKLMEGSVVTFPMNEKAQLLSIKSLEEVSALKDAEKFLKDKGLSCKEAKTLISKIKQFSLRDEDEIIKEDQKEEVKRDAMSESLSALNNTLDEIELKKSMKTLQNLITNK
tara:strand:+ start:5269 stop:6018 length:750 start_codon:yes stop_codon:yes gene_type:complete